MKKFAHDDEIGKGDLKVKANEDDDLEPLLTAVDDDSDDDGDGPPAHANENSKKPKKNK